MTWLSEFLKIMPKSVQVVILSGVLGVSLAWAHEQRYMTVSDYMKGYVLELKSEIRQINKDLGRKNIDQEIKELLREQLESLLDELCYEAPDDPYCKNRD